VNPLQCRQSFFRERNSSVELLSGFTGALERYSSFLSAYEVDEIQNYSEIWFLGLEADKVNAVTGGALNNGFDDQHGSYIKVQMK